MPLDIQSSVTRVTGAPALDSFRENARVASTLADLAARAKRGGASSTMFLPAEGLRYEAYAFGYGTHKPKQMNLRERPADGMVRGTIVINVSGHDGAERARQYAKTNSYNVSITLADGKRILLQNIPRANPQGEEYATKIPIELPWTEGAAIIEAWPNGSAGVGGYIEGRRYVVHMGKDYFDVDQARAEAAEWSRRNPNPTEHQTSPRPYADF